METFLTNARPKAGRTDAQTKVRKVGIYVRVSSDEQAENPEGSLKNQEERLKMAISLRNSHGSTAELCGVYSDTLSGKDMKRPAFKRLLSAIESGSINLVMVSELSRLTRSIKDFVHLWEFMQTHDCQFFSLRENFDTSTAAGEMLLFLIANFAQFERRQISERVAAGFLSRAFRGLWNGGVLPLGYEPDPDKRGSLRVVESEATVVRAAFEAVLREGSVYKAAKWLNQNGYAYSAPLRGGGCRARNRHFTFDSLYRLLSNPTYAGRRVIRSKDGKIQVVPAVWPTIVEPALFDRAQKCLEEGRRQKTGRESRFPYLLSTRIFCGECGVPLIGISAHGQTTKVPYYGHGSQIKREQTLATKGHRCDPFRVPGRKLEDRVWKEVVGLIESPTHRAPLYNAIRAQSESHDDAKELKRKEMELASIGEKLAGIVRRITDLPEGVPAEAFYEEMKRLAGSQTNLKAQIQESRQRGEGQRIASDAQYERLLAKLRHRLGDVSPESKRRIIQTLIQKVVVTKSGFELHYFAGVEQLKQGEAQASSSFSLEKKFSVQSLFKGLNGGRSNRVGELTGTREYAAQWARREIDLRELAALRDRGWPIYKLARRFRKRRDAIIAALRRLEGAGA